MAVSNSNSTNKRKKGKESESIEMVMGGENVGQNKDELASQAAAAAGASTAGERVGVKQKGCGKRKKEGPGIRIVGGRIFDSEGGKSCHQCRQKTRDIAAECKNIKKDKQCPMRYCHKCLQNRYGENVETAGSQTDWHCPKCRDICNCSFCMKKKGHRPTGILVRTAKATGFSSVSQMLETQGPDIVLRIKDDSRKLVSPKKGTNDDSGGTSDASSESGDLDAPGEESRNQEQTDRKVTGAIHSRFKKEDIHLEVTLPQGTKITNVANIELSPEDVGYVLQFLEFCATFEEIVGINKGQAECIIQDIMDGHGSRPGKYSAIIQFQIQLLTFLLRDLGEVSPSLSPGEDKNSWLKALRNLLSKSECELKHLVDWIDQGDNGYDMMGSSDKLKLLTFLCDETLGTMEVRSWIEDQNILFAEKEKEARGKAAAAKEKEKAMKQKLQDEFAKAILAKSGAPLTISEHEAIVTEIKAEAAKAHEDMVEAGGLPKRKQLSNAMRTEPMISDAKGRVCWRLKGYNSRIVLLDSATSVEKWYSFDDEEEKWIEQLACLFRVKRRRCNRGAEVIKEEDADPCSIPGSSSNADDSLPSASTR